MKPLITKSKAPILHQQHQEDRQCFEVEWMIRFTDAVFGITHFESINFQALNDYLLLLPSRLLRLRQ